MTNMQRGPAEAPSYFNDNLCVIMTKAHYLLKRCQLVAPKSLWPRTIIATKTKRTFLSRVVVAVVAFLCPLFLYQNAAVLYLNVDVPNFLHQRD